MSKARILRWALVLSFTGTPPLLDLRSKSAKGDEEKKAGEESKAGEEREFEIADGVKMNFCWIPAGEAQLGSPKLERDVAMKQQIAAGNVLNGKKPAWLSSEDESVRARYRSKGFWLGKYPVTQEEWKTVMGNNPSYLQPKGEGNHRLQKDKITDTSRFPVEMVSWKDCQIFLEKVNKREGVMKTFGNNGKFALPHEDEWEYACRGGKGNKQPFYWGSELNGTQANCDGNYPFGTLTNGPYLDRTCAVEFTNGGKYEKHPWGLCHMHGNVWQLCDNSFDQTKESRATRGGSWISAGGICRSALRYGEATDTRYHALGFRVCFRLDK